MEGGGRCCVVQCGMWSGGGRSVQGAVWAEATNQKLRGGPGRGGPGVQDMYTRLLSANLDFDPELQHVFCWAPGESRDSRVFHVDCVFLRLC